MNGLNCKSYVMTEDKFKDEIESQKEQAYVFVAYDRIDGKPIKIIPSPGTTVVCEGEHLPNDLIEILNLLREHGENIVETECDTSYFVHGSPGCRIKVTKSGEYKVICDE